MSKIIWNCKRALAAVSCDYNVKLYEQLKRKSIKQKITCDEAWWLLSQRKYFD